MKILRLLAPFLTLAFSLTAWADDRAGVEKTIAGLNNPSAKPSAVWAPGVHGPDERAKLTGGPMSEVGGGRIAVGTIQFPSRRAAVVSATQTQFGSIFGIRSIPLVIKMKKLRAGWRITEIVAPQ